MQHFAALPSNEVRILAADFVVFLFFFGGNNIELDIPQLTFEHEDFGVEKKTVSFTQSSIRDRKFIEGISHNLLITLWLEPNSTKVVRAFLPIYIIYIYMVHCKLFGYTYCTIHFYITKL